MSPTSRYFWPTLMAFLGTAYGIVVFNAYEGKHALDPVMPAVHGTQRTLMVSYLFHAGDCPDAADFIEQLDALAAAGHQVIGLMVTDNTNPRELRDVSHAYGIRFPVHALTTREAGLVLGALRQVRTPLAIVRDSSGAMRLLIPGRAPAPSVDQILAAARS